MHMLCRNGERGQQAVESLITTEEVPSNLLSLHIVDMSRPHTIRRFLQETSFAVDILINNAGCMLHEYHETEDGLETNFATNSLGPWCLTKWLLNGRVNDGGRVIMVTSAGMLTEKLVIPSNSPPDMVLAFIAYRHVFSCPRILHLTAPASMPSKSVTKPSWRNILPSTTRTSTFFRRIQAGPTLLPSVKPCQHFMCT